MIQDTETVGVVIAAFNEDGNLGPVLDVVLPLDWITEITVVDDGSTDGTLELAKQRMRFDSRAHMVRLPTNKGKANAMLSGVGSLKSDLVIFLDADLLGLRGFHLEVLCQPVQTRQCQMALAVFRHGGWLTDASHFLAPNLSGQRCLRRQDAEAALSPLRGTGYGVEAGLTLYAKQMNWSIQRVLWRGVTHRMKEQKRTLLAGIHSRWRMYRQIAAILSFSSSKRLSTRGHPTFLSRTDMRYSRDRHARRQ